jgi:1-acyl-sn-glycerol-3-phosphate acyltransferase
VIWRVLALPVRAILLAIGFLFFYGGAAVFSWIGIPLLILLKKEKAERIPIVRRIASLWARGLFGLGRFSRILAFNPGMDLAPLPSEPRVLIANHPTLVDVTAFLARYDQLCCVTKKRLFRDPFMGQILRQCEYIPGAVGGPFAGSSVVLAGINRLNAGQSVLVFPEGTRSPISGQHVFQRGAFEMAIRARVPVLPFLVTCDPVILNREASLFQVLWQSSRYSIIQLPELDPKDWQGDAAAMAAYAEDLFSAASSSLPIELGR